MSQDNNLRDNEYHGLILKDKDIKMQGRYLVHIPELHHIIQQNVGIWCRNHTNNNRITDSDSGKYGSYSPLHSGTKVIVKFYENDLNTGYIDRVISDQSSNSLPFKSTDRDDVYLLLRTPKNGNVICFLEDTVDQPPNSFHLLFNQNRSMLVIDEQGIHIYTDDNYDIQIHGDCNIKTDSQCNIEALSECNIRSVGNCNIYGLSGVNVKSSGMVNIDGATVNINAGLSQSADNATVPSFTPSKEKSSSSQVSIPILD